MNRIYLTRAIKFDIVLSFGVRYIKKDYFLLVVFTLLRYIAQNCNILDFFLYHESDSNIKNLVSSMEYRVSSIEYQVLSIKY